MTQAFVALTDKLAPFAYLLSGLLIVLAWLVPSHYYPWTAFYNEFPAALGFWLLGFTLFFLQGNGLSSSDTVPRWALGLAALVLIPLLQYQTGLIHFYGDAVMAALYLAGFAMAYVVGSLLGRAQPRGAYWDSTEMIALAFLVGALASWIVVLCQWLGVGDATGLVETLVSERVYANLAQPNNLATLLVLGLVSSLYLRERGRISGALTALLALLLLFSIALTLSRTPFVVMVFIVVWLLWQRQHLMLKCTPWEIAVGVGVFLALVLLLPVVPEWFYLLEGDGAASAPVDRQGTHRLRLWHGLLNAAIREPFIGYGWNQVSFAQISVAADYPGSMPAWRSHNILIDLLIWNGLILGGVLCLATMYWAVTRIWRCRDIRSWYGLMVIGVVGIHGLLEFPLEYAYFLLPVGLCVGVVDSFYPVQTLKVPRWAFCLVMLVFGGMLGRVFIEYRYLQQYTLAQRFEARGLANVQYPEIRSVYLLTQVAANLDFMATYAREGMSADELVRMEHVAHRYPASSALLRYALALGLNGEEEAAALELLRLKSMNVPLLYEQAREAWVLLIQQYPQLERVKVPWLNYNEP